MLHYCKWQRTFATVILMIKASTNFYDVWALLDKSYAYMHICAYTHIKLISPYHKTHEALVIPLFWWVNWGMRVLNYRNTGKSDIERLLVFYCKKVDPSFHSPSIVKHHPGGYVSSCKNLFTSISLLQGGSIFRN